PPPAWRVGGDPPGLDAGAPGADGRSVRRLVALPGLLSRVPRRARRHPVRRYGADAHGLLRRAGDTRAAVDRGGSAGLDRPLVRVAAGVPETPARHPCAVADLDVRLGHRGGDLLHAAKQLRALSPARPGAGTSSWLDQAWPPGCGPGERAS